MQILVPVWYPFLKSKHLTKRKSPDFRAFLSSGGGIRTRDLRVMSRIWAIRLVRPDAAECWHVQAFCGFDGVVVLA
jgi:hypothetical protein